MSPLSKDYIRYTLLFMLIGWGSCLIFSAIGCPLHKSLWLYTPVCLEGYPQQSLPS